MLFAFQVGILSILKEKGLQASAVVGHSVGEVAAAWASGILDLKEAVKVIFYRSHAQAKTAGAGRMAAAAMSKEDVTGIIKDLDLNNEITIAGINSPKSVTLSGSLKALKILEEKFAKELNADYWWRNIRQPVLFSDAMNTLLNEDYQVFVEIGPHPVLRSYINECGREKDFEIASISTIKRQSESLSTLLNSLYSCYLAGSSLNYELVFPETFDNNKYNFTLPHYPWQRERHWYNLIVIDNILCWVIA